MASFDHQDEVSHAAFSPDGTRVLTASSDKTAKLWDAASGKLLVSFAHQYYVRHAAFNPDGARILTACWTHSLPTCIGPMLNAPVSLWDAASGKLIVSFDHPEGLYHAEFSPDGARILTASGDTAKLWNVPSGKLIACFEHQDAVPWAGFSPDGTRILTVSRDKTANLWDSATPGELAQEVNAQQVESLSAIASGLEFSDEGSLVAVNEEQRSNLTNQLKDLAQGLGPAARFMRWFFSTGSDRTIFPASDLKIAEWVDNALLTNSNVTEE